MLHSGVQVGLAGAFIGGLLSLLSPCSVMLMPAFFSYAFGEARTLVSRTAVFYTGLVCTLVPLGAFAGALGARLLENRGVVFTVAAVVLIGLGVWQALSLPMPGSRGVGPARGTNAASVWVLGAVYGLAGACSGPLLGSILTFAAFGASWSYGALLMVVFAGGMTVPLAVLGWAWARAPWVRGLVRPRMLAIGPVRTTWTQLASGLLAVAVGVALLASGAPDGWSGLAGPGGADGQVHLEVWATRMSAHVSDRTLLGAGLLLAAAAVAAHALASRRTTLHPRSQRSTGE